jgi:hypothetical protein
MYEYRCDERLKAKVEGSAPVTSHIHWVPWGTGTPKDRDEINRREVCECDGWVWDRDNKGAPSIFKVIRSLAVSAPIYSRHGVLTSVCFCFGVEWHVKRSRVKIVRWNMCAIWRPLVMVRPDIMSVMARYENKSATCLLVRCVDEQTGSPTYIRHGVLTSMLSLHRLITEDVERSSWCVVSVRHVTGPRKTCYHMLPVRFRSHRYRFYLVKWLTGTGSNRWSAGFTGTSRWPTGNRITGRDHRPVTCVVCPLSVEEYNHTNENKTKYITIKNISSW